MSERRPLRVWAGACAEGLAAAAAGLLALGMIAASVSALLREGPRTLLVWTFLAVPFVWALLVCRRSGESCRRIWRGEAKPASFFSIDWRSGLSFLIVAGGISTLGTLAIRSRNRIVELGRVYPAVAFLAQLREAQDSCKASRKRYCEKLEEMKLQPPRYFVTELIVERQPPAWRVALRRKEEEISARYGRYAIVTGSQRDALDCEGGADPRRCRDELLP